MESPIKFGISLVFDGLDVENHDVVSAIFAALPGATPSTTNGVVSASSPVIAFTAEDAALELAKNICAIVPGAIPVRVDQDLVSVPDIAQRVGRTRESVRLLADGTRGPGNFRFRSVPSVTEFESGLGAMFLTGFAMFLV